MDIERLKHIFARAAAIKSPAERKLYLDQACARDASARKQVEDMLAAQPHLGDFLEPRIETDKLNNGVELIGQEVGLYKILQQIGEGGFGVVYLAEQELPVRRKVALKIIKAGMDTKQVIARFDAERQALAMMEHPNIARVLDAGETDQGRPYFVMELVKGIPITEYCDQRRLKTRERIELFIKVCQAVQHAHQKGIIHRDLKPSNVMITLIDGEPVPKVIDFGVAKAMDQKLTQHTLFTRYDQLIGTPAYMSPEQAELSGVDVDTRSDIYSLGVLLYQLLTGSPPIDEETLKKAGLDEVRRMIRETDPPKPSTWLQTLGKQLTTVAEQRQVDPSTLCRSIHGDLDWVVMKALDKQRHRRYETANGLAMDLQRHLNNEPVVAGPPSVVYRVQKFVRRNRSVAIAGAAVALALVTGLVLAIAGLLKANAERNHAVRAEHRASAAATQLRHNLVRSDLAAANRLFDDNKTPEAIAHLARAVRKDPTYWPATMRLMSALLNRGFPREVAVLEQEEPIQQVAISDDDSLICTVDTAGTMKVWDTQTWQPRRIPPFTEPVGYCRFVRGTSLLMVFTRSRKVRIWDAKDGRAKSTPGDPNRKFDGIYGGALKEPDVVVEVAGKTSYGVEVWNAETGTKVMDSGGKQFYNPAPIIAGRSARDAVVYAPMFREVGVWKVTNGEFLGAFGKNVKFGDRANCSQDGRLLMIFDNQRKQGSWFDVRTGRTLAEDIPFNHEVIAKSEDGEWLTGIGTRDYCGFSPDGKLAYFIGFESGEHGLVEGKVYHVDSGDLAASFSADAYTGLVENSSIGFQFGVFGAITDSHTLQFWSLETGVTLAEFHCEKEFRKIWFSPDASVVVSSHADNSVRVWSIPDRKLKYELTRLGAEPIDVYFSPDQSLLFLSTADGSLHFLNTDTGRPILERAFAPYLFALKAINRGRQLVTWQHKSGPQGHLEIGRVRVFDLATAAAEPNPLFKGDNGINDAIISEDGRTLQTLRFTGGIQIDGENYRQGFLESWNTESGKLIDSESLPPRYKSAFFSPDWKRLVVFHADRATAMQASVYARGRTDPLSTIHFDVPLMAGSEMIMSRHAKYAMAVGSDHHLRVWNLETGQRAIPPQLLGNDIHIAHAFDHPKDKFLVLNRAGYGRDAALEVWDLAKGKRLYSPIKESSSATCITFTPDGNAFACGFSDRKCRVYEARTGRLLNSFDHPDSRVIQVVVSPDNRRVLTTIGLHSDAPSTDTIWDLMSSKRIGARRFNRFGHFCDFTRDGRGIVSMSRIEVPIIWEPESGQVVQEPVARPYQLAELNGYYESKGMAMGVQGAIVAIPGTKYRALQRFLDPVKKAPEWLPDLAEAITGLRINAAGSPEPVPGNPLPEVSNLIYSLELETPEVSWARWILEDRAARSISPYSAMPKAELASRLRDSGEPELLKRSLTFAPNDGVTIARLADEEAGEFITNRGSRSGHWMTAPEYWSNQSTNWAPNSGEVWWRRADIFRLLGKPQQSQRALERANVLEPDNPNISWVRAMDLADSDPGRAYGFYCDAINQVKKLSASDKRVIGLGLLPLISDKDPNNADSISEVLLNQFDSLFQESPGTDQARELEWLSRYLLQTGSTEAGVIEPAVIALARVGKTNGLDQVISTLPDALSDSPARWYAESVLCRLGGATGLALTALRRAGERAVWNRAVDPRIRNGILRQLELALRKNGHSEEADKVGLRRRIPLRDARAGKHQIDLAPYYNAFVADSELTPHHNTNTFVAEFDLSSYGFPFGYVHLPLVPDTAFDVRGAVSLDWQGAQAHAVKAPREVVGIPVNQKVGHLHFLQMTAYGNATSTGALVAKIVIHFESGREPVNYEFLAGINTADWWYIEHLTMNPPEARVAWRQRLSDSESRQLYLATWVNPHPEDPVTSVDYISGMSVGQHFLFAITAE